MHRSPLLLLHITAGIFGVLAGAVAATFRKGSQGHRLSGMAFVFAMFTMAGLGAFLAVLKNQPTNVCAGVITCYLVATAWITARRQKLQTGLFDWFAFLAALAVAVVILTMGIEVVRGILPVSPNAPTPAYFVMGSIAFLSAAGDLRMILRGTLSSTQRLVRHLWRMCFAFFIASGSFFLGQQQVFPESWRGSPLLTIPALLPLLLLVFWFFRVRFSNTYKQKGSLPGAQPSLSTD
jgi:hypothetical protein